MDVRGAPVHVGVSEEDLQLGLCPLLAAGLAALAPGLGEEEAGEGLPGGEAHHHALAAARQAHCSAQRSVPITARQITITEKALTRTVKVPTRTFS